MLTFVSIIAEHSSTSLTLETSCVLIDLSRYSFELFYQIGLSDFGNYGTIKLDPPLPIKELLRIAASHERQEQESDEDVVMTDSAGVGSKANRTDFDWEEAVEVRILGGA